MFESDRFARLRVALGVPLEGLNNIDTKRTHVSSIIHMQHFWRPHIELMEELIAS